MPAECTATRYHRPRPVQIDTHHVWPRAHGGPTLPGNLAEVCGSCHEAIHSLLRLYEAGPVGWLARKTYPRGVQRLAAQGWRRIQAKAMVP